MADAEYPRDLRGYGRNPPDPQWPDGARIAVQFVVNFEEGGENNILHGDPRLGSLPVGCARRAAVAGTTPRQHRIDVRIRLARRLLAAVARLYRAQAAGHRVRRRDRAATQSRDRRGDERGRLGHRQPQPEMGRAPQYAGSGGAGDHCGGDPHSHRGHRRAAARLVHRTVLDQHAAAGDGGRRFSVFLQFLRRRSALLGQGRGGPASRHSLQPRCQRHAFCQCPGFWRRRAVLQLSQGQF